MTNYSTLSDVGLVAHVFQDAYDLAAMRKIAEQFNVHRDIGGRTHNAYAHQLASLLLSRGYIQRGEVGWQTYGILRSFINSATALDPLVERFGWEF